MKDIENMKMDELHGIISTYEIRIAKGNSTLKEVAFKVSNKIE